MKDYLVWVDCEMTGLDLEQSTVNRQVHAAIDAGWLERFDVPGSASRLVRPTPAGLEAYQHDGLVRAATIHAALDALGPERAASITSGCGWPWSEAMMICFTTP